MAKKKTSSRKRLGNFLKVSGIVVLFLLLVVVSLNALLRKPYVLSDAELRALETVYSDEQLSRITWYQGGMYSLGSPKVVCDDFYYNRDFLEYYAWVEQEGGYSLKPGTAVHEAFHTVQFRGFFSCLSGTVRSLSSQFKAFLTTGSRGSAYYYHLLGDDSYNIEQEASIIEDYYNLKYLNFSVEHSNCLDCEELSLEEIIHILEEKKNVLLEKYA
jgi:hypothetical protein